MNRVFNIVGEIGAELKVSVLSRPLYIISSMQIQVHNQNQSTWPIYLKVLPNATSQSRSLVFLSPLSVVILDELTSKERAC